MPFCSIGFSILAVAVMFCFVFLEQDKTVFGLEDRVLSYQLILSSFCVVRPSVLCFRLILVFRVLYLMFSIPTCVLTQCSVHVSEFVFLCISVSLCPTSSVCLFPRILWFQVWFLVFSILCISKLRSRHPRFCFSSFTVNKTHSHHCLGLSLGSFFRPHNCCHSHDKNWWTWFARHIQMNLTN